MKRFTVSTVHLHTTRFTGAEYRAYFGCDDTDEQIAADLEENAGDFLNLIQNHHSIGTRSTTTETTHDSRDYQEQPCPTDFSPETS